MDWKSIRQSANKEHIYMLTKALCLFSKYESVPQEYILLRHSKAKGTFSRFFTAYGNNADKIFIQIAESHINSFCVKLPTLLRKDTQIIKMFNMLYEKPEIYLKTSINLKGIEKLQLYSTGFKETCEYTYFKLYANYIKRNIQYLCQALIIYIKNKKENIHNECDNIKAQIVKLQFIENYFNECISNMTIQ